MCCGMMELDLTCMRSGTVAGAGGAEGSGKLRRKESRAVELGLERILKPQEHATARGLESLDHFVLLSILYNFTIPVLEHGMLKAVKMHVGAPGTVQNLTTNPIAPK